VETAGVEIDWVLLVERRVLTTEEIVIGRALLR
jgi:hypothetical protein